MANRPHRGQRPPRPQSRPDPWRAAANAQNPRGPSAPTPRQVLRHQGNPGPSSRPPQRSNQGRAAEVSCLPTVPEQALGRGLLSPGSHLILRTKLGRNSMIPSSALLSSQTAVKGSWTQTHHMLSWKGPSPPLPPPLLFRIGQSFWGRGAGPTPAPWPTTEGHIRALGSPHTCPAWRGAQRLQPLWSMRWQASPARTGPSVPCRGRCWKTVNPVPVFASPSCGTWGAGHWGPPVRPVLGFLARRVDLHRSPVIQRSPCFLAAWTGARVVCRPPGLRS